MARENYFSRRLATMILLIVDHCQKKGSTVRRTSLNKLLFFSDLVWFLKTEETLSGVTYQKLDYGPVPVNIRKVRNDLLVLGLLEEEMVNSYGYPAYLYYPSASVEISKVEKKFHPEKIELLRLVSDRLGGLSASALSNHSHMYEPWKSASWFSELDLNEARNDKKLLDWLKEEGLLLPDKEV